MTSRRSCRGPIVLALLATLLLQIPAISYAAASAPSVAVVEPPKGAGTPVAATGIGTEAALDNPRCNTDERYGVYGRFDSHVVGGGPICVKPWKSGASNGGTTTPGVTKDAITVVFVVPNAEQIRAAGASAGAAPTNRASGAAGTYADAAHDWLLAQLPFYETWGRDLNVKVFTSTGDDEAAQRADAIAVKAMKPFAVVDFVTTGLDVFEAETAKNKILVWGYGTSATEALAATPYRWGSLDAEAAGVNAAEVIGKQLVGKKAQYAGSEELKTQTRNFGVVYIEDVIDTGRFKETLKKYKGTVSTEVSYAGVGDTFGNATTAAEQAPTMVTKLKNDDVTTVVLFTDVAMNKALMEQATAQEWYPEWFFSGSNLFDIGALARTYPADQVRHGFGIMNLPPWLKPDPDPAVASISSLAGPIDYYWGTGRGTTSPRVVAQVAWLLNGIHTAGPKLTPQTFRQGLFSIPATGGAATGNPLLPMSGYGRTTGLPYDGYLNSNADFAPGWIDPDTEGPSAGAGVTVKTVTWYVDDGKRYKAGGWPTAPIPWFDKTKAIVEFTTRPPSAPTPVAAPACTTCPNGGGSSVQPGIPSPDGFVAEAQPSSTS